jgi:hypothetical protein
VRDARSARSARPESCRVDVSPGQVFVVQVRIVDVNDGTLLTKNTVAMVTLAAPDGQGRALARVQHNTTKVAALPRGCG